ncbi:unnamed protein product, partial [Adineta steineri]
GYQTTLTGQSYCRICSPGHFCPNAAGNPILCEAGYANNQHGRVECDLCPQGTYTDVAGLAYCITCPPGMICTNTRMSPKA